MIGRLIQQNKVRPGEQYLAQRNARLLSAGERRDAEIEFRLIKPESLEDAGHLTLDGVAVFAVELLAQAVVGAVQLRQFLLGSIFHLRLEFTKLIGNAENIAFGVHQLIVYGGIRVHVRMLRKIADGCILADGHLAAVRRQFAGENLKKRRFAGSVIADQRHLLMFFYIKGNILQYLIDAKGKTYFMA